MNDLFKVSIKRRKKVLLVFLSFLYLSLSIQAQQFKISYTSSVFKGPFSGHVVLYLSKDNKNPKNGLSYPCYGAVVKSVKPRQVITFADNVVSFPVKLTKIARGDYYVQVVLDRNLGGRSIGTSPGNLYSKPQKIVITQNLTESFTIVCDQIILAKTFIETSFVKELKAPSKLLSKFHQKEMTVDAPVILPAEYYKEPKRYFPVFFIVAGYGSDYHHYSKTESSDTLPATPMDTIPCIKVYLDGNCSWGHSCYANSDNNGPWGDAFTQEFIPLLETKFRCNGARLMRGHSSGGWTALWLIIHYPKLFAGVSASAPDPVDFHKFTLTNLYTDIKQIEEVDYLSIGSTTTRVDTARGTSDGRHSIEDVLYRGEQNNSFNAVFSGKGPDGTPGKIFDPVTGKINRNVFSQWKRYDISLYLRNNWDQLKKDLDGKVRISVGTEDNAYLNVPVEMLDKEMKRLQSHFEFAYYPGTHFTVATPEYKKAEIIFLEQKYLEWLSRNECETR